MAEVESIKQIIDDCGGPGSVAAGARRKGTRLTKWAVYKWLGSGVPPKHWGLLAELSGKNEFTIFKANTQLQQARVAQKRAA
ncbi:hypothetical protein [Roseibium suaedae]|uniref:Transcriptional regulator n=1 Tax=Roseibium suaedae TaxID=735517 RepID=A0A1M7D6J7_9HYPH|nr:hypothetical protein [Roseibium suaedae]SHL75132.1 hypothetical protein SAMN05444272_1388 [Roseibium suaedae]